MTPAPHQRASAASSPRYLVLLASCNGEPFIRQQIESILGQQDVDASILVADDASSDGTAAIAEALGADGRVKVQRHASASGRAAQNFLRLLRDAEASTFDFVALSDQDDIWMPDKLRRAADMLAGSGRAGYSSSVMARWADGRESVFRQSSAHRAADFLFEGAGQGCTIVLTQQFFQRAQAIFRDHADATTTLIYHDWAIYALARCLDAEWHFDARPTMWYRQHATNDTGARLSIAGLRRRLAMLQEGRYKTQVQAVAELCARIHPPHSAVNAWRALESIPSLPSRRLRKAIFCLRHGRRRNLDRVLTAFAALCGWI